ncbi:hypothetical protein D3C80_876730 [compost metagenome]
MQVLKQVFQRDGARLPGCEKRGQFLSREAGGVDVRVQPILNLAPDPRPIGHEGQRLGQAVRQGVGDAGHDGGFPRALNPGSLGGDGLLVGLQQHPGAHEGRILALGFQGEAKLRQARAGELHELGVAIGRHRDALGRAELDGLTLSDVQPLEHWRRVSRPQQRPFQGGRVVQVGDADLGQVGQRRLGRDRFAIARVAEEGGDFRERLVVLARGDGLDRLPLALLFAPDLLLILAFDQFQHADLLDGLQAEVRPLDLDHLPDPDLTRTTRGP